LLEHLPDQSRLGAESREELLQAVTLLRTKLPESHPAILRVLNELCGLEMAMPDDAPDCAQTARASSMTRIPRRSCALRST